MFSLLDILLVLMMLISGILAMIRGFTREFLSIASWAAAAAAILIVLNYPAYSALLEPYIGNRLAAQIIQSFVIFVIVLVIVHLITIYLSDKILSSSMGALDHTLGFIFGLARGLVVVVVMYLLLSAFVTVEVHNQWVGNSRSLPLVKGTGEMIISLLPQNLAEMISKQVSKNEIQQDKLPKIRRRNQQPDKNRGYAASERRQLNQLMESTSSIQN